MSEESREYEITTLRDVYEKIPEDRVELCMAELAKGIVEAKQANRMVREIAEMVGEKIDGDALCFPESITWIDDDKGEFTYRIHVNGDHVGEVKRTTKNESNER